MLKKQSGITLVALVITIIVLLILAGVSISLVVGNNGVLTQASTSVVKTKAADVRQALQMALQTAETTYYAKWTSNTLVKRGEIYNADVNYAGSVANELKNQGVEIKSPATLAFSATTYTSTGANVVLEKDGQTFRINVGVNENSGAVFLSNTVEIMDAAGTTVDETITL